MVNRIVCVAEVGAISRIEGSLKNGGVRCHKWSVLNYREPRGLPSLTSITTCR